MKLTKIQIQALRDVRDGRSLKCGCRTVGSLLDRGLVEFAPIGVKLTQEGRAFLKGTKSQ